MYMVRYIPHQGWYLFKDDKMISVVSHNSEWDALDELKGIDPKAAEELERILCT